MKLNKTSFIIALCIFGCLDQNTDSSTSMFEISTSGNKMDMLIEVSTSDNSSSSDFESSSSSTSEDISLSSSSTTFESVCGNGVLEGFEDCDDGNLEQLDYCSNSCEFPRKIFLTSAQFTGEKIGTIKGANKLCNELALKAEINGNFKAWLSNKDTSPSNQFDINFRGKYELINPFIIIAAYGWSDLTDGDILAYININERGETENIFMNPWSNTDSSGKSFKENDCFGWSRNLGYLGHRGSILHINNFWTHWDTVPCSTESPLICIEDYK